MSAGVTPKVNLRSLLNTCNEACKWVDPSLAFKPRQTSPAIQKGAHKKDLLYEICVIPKRRHYSFTKKKKKTEETMCVWIWSVFPSIAISFVGIHLRIIVGCNQAFPASNSPNTFKLPLPITDETAFFVIFLLVRVTRRIKRRESVVVRWGPNGIFSK